MQADTILIQLLAKALLSRAEQASVQDPDNYFYTSAVTVFKLLLYSGDPVNAVSGVWTVT